MKILSGRTMDRPGRQKHYKNIRFSGWTKTKSDIVEALKDPDFDTQELKRYVRYAISEAEAAAAKLDEYRGILEKLNRSSYSSADKDSAILDLQNSSLSQADLHR